MKMVKMKKMQILTKEKLDNWYNRHMNITNADISTAEIFQLVYNTKYETMIDNYSYYWLSSSYLSGYVSCVNPSGRTVGRHSGIAFGTRMLIDLSPDVKFSSERVGTKTLKDPRNTEKNWTYNIWDIK